MIFLLCSRGDESARFFARRWAERDVCAITCEDVSRAGWNLRVPQREGPASLTQGRAAAAGRRVAAEEIHGVITRLPFVSEYELPHIVAEDRQYVAAEMQAFLYAFLMALDCSVVNRPSPALLAGPNVRSLQWRRRAAELGIPIPRDPIHVSMRREESAGRASPAFPDGASHVELVVVGDRVIGDASARLREQARCLARSFCVDFLRVRFTGASDAAQFLGADVWPDLESEPVATALFDHLERTGRLC